MTVRRFGRIQIPWSGVLVACLLSGCAGRTLMPTPNLYVSPGADVFANVPPELRESTVDVLYATDREPERGKDGTLRYGYGRSPSLAFGSCVVAIGEDVPWAELIAESRSRKRARPLKVAVRKVTEYGRLPEDPMPLVEGPKGPVTDPAAAAVREEASEHFCRELEERLARTPRKEAYVFVHGYNNAFEDGAIVIAELWHFLGRAGVPVLYTWPAGRGGLKGYGYDRESGEFTVYHFKQFIRMLAACPGLEKIQVIAHSRGTDVFASALRELNIEARAAGKDPREALKIGNVVLAAPDLDFEVATQRIAAERLSDSVERLTVYVSERDRAIGLADWLLASIRRIGQLREEDLTEEEWELLEKIHRTHFIDARVKSGFFGHSYFHSNPSVSSDLILLLRENRDPGEENGRPLVRRRSNYWELEEGYPEGRMEE